MSAAVAFDPVAAYRAAVETFIDTQPVPNWEVRDYATGDVVHHADTYEEADDWRLVNEPAAVVVPHWRQP